jgi:ribulose-bisphosphate carboxylase large chain
MTLTRLPEMLELYGNDVLLLVGGDLYRRSDDLAENARRFLGVLGR